MAKSPIVNWDDAMQKKQVNPIGSAIVLDLGREADLIWDIPTQRPKATSLLDNGMEKAQCKTQLFPFFRLGT